MAYVYTTNFDVDTSYARMFTQFVSTATGAGWTIVRWSDGTAITTGPAGWGASVMDASGSWVIIQQPSTGSAPFSGSRQLLIWKRNSIASGDHQWTFNYSRTGFNNTMAETATTPATTSASDEVSAISSNNSISPYASARNILSFSSTPSVGPKISTHVCQIGVSDSAPFSAWIVLYPKLSTVGGSSSTSNSWRFAWVMQGMATGSFAYDAGSASDATVTDQDPYVFSTHRDLTSVFDDNLSSSIMERHFSLRKAAQASMSWVNLSSSFSRQDTGYNHVTGKVDLLPMNFLKTSSSDAMHKGVGELSRYVSESDVTNLTLLDGTVDRVVFGTVALPWDNLATAPTP